MGRTAADADESASAWAGARMRREPQQERSRTRVRQILAAADQVLAADGFEALTVRRIAQSAHVPVGSIYQFFPDKAAVIDALARTYIEEFAAAIEELVVAAQGSVWADPVKTLVDAFAQMYRSRPGYVALWAGRHLSPQLAEVDEANNAAIADGVRQVLIAQTGLADSATLGRISRTAVVVADALLQFAFHDGPDGDEFVLDELKTMLRLYLADVTRRLSGPDSAPGQ
ncbi:MAG TPA: TetR/AcrR family transcriptional regulator [Actinocrinis sp.]|nr:TetR/AcrR family transcriptional regulator [Actinocrinis sp.]